jgi:hypothetical protein
MKDKTLTDDEFDELHDSRFDTIEVIAEYDLTKDQYEQLSIAEQQDYNSIRKHK